MNTENPDRTQGEPIEYGRFFSHESSAHQLQEVSIAVPEDDFIEGVHEECPLEDVQYMYEFHFEVMKVMAWDDDEESQMGKALHERGLEILKKAVETYPVPLTTEEEGGDRVLN